ncbi:MAG: TIGR00730 family Rossman fold protein [Flavobacteriales bacterium]
MKSITVFCGASEGDNPIYKETGLQVGALLAAHNIEVVFGGGKIGIMGAVADGALAEGGIVTGVIPKFLRTKEVTHYGVTNLHVVETMHERKMLMHRLSQGVMALPGGYGTLDELFEILTWGQLGMHEYPIGLLNVNGYFNHLVAFVGHMCKEGFLSQIVHDLILVDDDATLLIERMKNYRAQEIYKWLTEDEV